MRNSTFRLAGVQPGQLACVVVALTEARHQVGGHLAFAGGWLSLELFPATGPTHSSEANTDPYQDSEFLGQAFRLAAADGILGIVSFSDPVRRIRQDGTIIFPAIPASSIKPRTLYVGRGTVRRVAFFHRHGTVHLSRRERSGHRWCPRQRSRPEYLSSHRVLRERAHMPMTARCQDS